MMKLVRAVVFAVCAFGVHAVACAGDDAYGRCVARIDSLRTDPVEGIWQMNAVGGGALFSVIASPGRPGVFELRLLEAPDWRVEPGALCGEVRAASRPGVYDCRMAASPGAEKPLGLGKYTATLELDAADGRLIFKPYSTTRRVSLRRWIPYFFRIVVHEENTRPRDLEGAVRVYPPAPGSMPVSL